MLGTHSADSMLKIMDDKNDKEVTSTRWCTWITSVIAHFMLFIPILQVISWIPLAGFLLAKMFALAFVIFAFIWATMIHMIIMACSWIFYRPKFAMMMFAGIGFCLLCTQIGFGTSYDQQAEAVPFEGDPS